MGYEKREWQDDVTELDKEFFDYLQNGIIDAHNRADALERWMNKANYKKISVNVTKGGVDLLYGTNITNTAHPQFKWKLSKDATEVSITTPGIGSNYGSLTHTKKLVTDANTGEVYIEVTSPLFGKIHVKKEGTDEETVEWAELNEGVTKTASEVYNSYRSISLKANVESSFNDNDYFYAVLGQLQWTIEAVEADGEVDDNGNITYGHGKGYYTINASYNVYYGKSKNANENSAEFIGNMSVYGRVKSKSSLDIEFETGVDDEYLYFALPRVFYESDKTTFDIWKTGFKEEFVVTAAVGVELVSSLYPATYNLFRSPNKITDSNAFEVRIS